MAPARRFGRGRGGRLVEVGAPLRRRAGSPQIRRERGYGGVAARPRALGDASGLPFAEGGHGSR
jgi:hypothetical protein